MRTSLKVVFAILLLLAVGSELAHRVVYTAQAEGFMPPTSRQMKVDEAVPEVKSAIVDKTNFSQPQNLSASAGESQQSATSSAVRNRLPEQVPVNTTIDEFREIYTQFTQQYIQPGWLHLIYREEHPAADGPNETDYGITVPEPFILEHWYLLNGSGQVTQGVSLMRDVSGNIVQVSVYRDRVWRNLTLGTDMPVDSSPAVRLDGWYLTQMEDAYATGGQAYRTDASIDGKPIIQFTQTEEFDPPILLYGYPCPIKQAKKLAYVNPVSNEISIIETHFITSNGDEVTFSKTILLTIENIKPPDEILTYLEETK